MLAGCKETFRMFIEGLRDSIHGYASYLLSKERLHHSSQQPAANPTDNSVTRFLDRVNHTCDSLQSLNRALLSSSTYSPVPVCDFAPTDRRKRYAYIKEIEKGLIVPTVLFTYTPGGSILNHHFIWRVPDSFDVDAAVGENERVVCKIKSQLPVVQ